MDIAGLTYFATSRQTVCGSLLRAGVAKTVLIRLLIGLGGCSIIAVVFPFEPVHLRCLYMASRTVVLALLGHMQQPSALSESAAAWESPAACGGRTWLT